MKKSSHIKNWAEKKTMHWRLQFYLLKVNNGGSNSKDNKNGMKLEEMGLHVIRSSLKLRLRAAPLQFHSQSVTHKSYVEETVPS